MKEKVIIGERIGIKTILAGYVEWSIVLLDGSCWILIIWLDVILLVILE